MPAAILLDHDALRVGRPHDEARLHVRQFREAKGRLEVPRITVPVVVIAHCADDGLRARLPSTAGAATPRGKRIAARPPMGVKSTSSTGWSASRPWGQAVEQQHIARATRRTVLAGIAATLAPRAQAQQSNGMRRVGVLMPGISNDPLLGQVYSAALIQGLAALNWREGYNLRLDWRCRDDRRMRQARCDAGWSGS